LLDALSMGWNFSSALFGIYKIVQSFRWRPLRWRATSTESRALVSSFSGKGTTVSIPSCGVKEPWYGTKMTIRLHLVSHRISLVGIAD
jgi:hypothetical protein